MSMREQGLAVTSQMDPAHTTFLSASRLGREWIEKWGMAYMFACDHGAAATDDCAVRIMAAYKTDFPTAIWSTAESDADEEYILSVVHKVCVNSFSY